MKGNGAIGVTIALAALILGGIAVYGSYFKHKVAYVELQEVFNEFEMTKQYKGKLEAVVMSRKSIADSLELSLTAQSKSFTTASDRNSPQVQRFLYEKEYYMERMKQFQEDNIALKQKYDLEINKQINQYVKEYGEKNNYEFIYGADGSGVLMYAEEKLNRTEEVIKYINERYKGEGK